MENLSLFDFLKSPLKIDKPIRLIELFAGVGSQAKALKRLGADFEHYRVCEWDKYAIKSYNAVHGTNFATSDIRQITADELGIVDTDKYCYMMTYSFPCQDLSVAGKQMGMAKGDNTRSGLLWEVERLLNECDELPQVLLMENVTQVHGAKNKEHFNKWIEFLESKGYSNYWEDLNAKHFGVPQNRNRTFMVSALGDYVYHFPKEFPLELRLKDVLEDSVDEKFYLSGKMINYLHATTEKNKARGNGNVYSPVDVDGVSKCITTKEGARVIDNFIEEQPLLIGGLQKNQSVKTDGVCTCLTSAMGAGGGYVPMVTDPTCEQAGVLTGGKWDKRNDMARRVYSGNGLAPTILTCGGGNNEPKVVEPQASVDSYYVSEKGVRFICHPKRGMTTDINAGVAQPLTAKGQANWTGSFISPDIECLEKSSTIGGTEPTKIHLKNGETITSNDNLSGLRIRKLTPKECWRLMGFDDADFEKAEKVNSNSQLYKQAGNSIVVNVLEEIFRQMF